MENDADESLADVDSLNLSSKDAPLEENQDGTDPEWKLLEEAEMEDDGDDKEKDTQEAKPCIDPQTCCPKQMKEV